MSHSIKTCEYDKCDNTFEAYAVGTSREQKYCSKKCGDAQYHMQNKNKRRAQHRSYHLKNRDSILDRQKKRRLKNIDKVRDYWKGYVKKRRKSDPVFNLRSGVSRLLNAALRRGNFTKSSKTQNYLGCTWEEFKEYIESQFTEGMSWGNRSEWHLDHIVPISWADSEWEVWALSHYSNLRPLWAEDNLKKGNRYATL